MLINDKVVFALAIETTLILNQKQDQLRKIKWTNGEANLDMEYSNLACEICRSEAWPAIKRMFPEYSHINIECHAPDIMITFWMERDLPMLHEKVFVEKKIELKSSKSRKMPGSTIKKLDINQPLIYCLRSTNPTDPYILKCSQYHTAIGESNHELFQDRTPRPFINFENMKQQPIPNDFVTKEKNDWIKHYADCAIERIGSQCQYSWQDDMIKLIKQKIITQFIENTSIEQFTESKVLANLSDMQISDSTD